MNERTTNGKRKAVIAGVGPGNGMAIARRFAGAGYDLALLARSKDKLKSYARELSETAQKVKTVAVDFVDIEKTEKKVDEAVRKLGGVDVLVYNASIFREATWREYPPSALMEEVSIGAGGAYAAFRAAGRHMDAGGAIIATGGGSAIHPEELRAAPGLAVAKGALRNLILALHGPFADDGILLSTLTIDGAVKEGTFFDPKNIADAVFALSQTPRPQWRGEEVYAE
ncbi:MAG: SDR family NAD(P)-dependent oxidoreductase [Pseudomonadota bacterium]